MNVETRTVKGVLIVQPTGPRITAAGGAEEFHDVVAKAIRDGHLAIAIDLSGVEYADTAMIGALSQSCKELTQVGGLICLFNVKPEVHEFFRQTVLDRFIEICKDEQTALELFEGRPKKQGKGLLRRLFS